MAEDWQVEARTLARKRMAAWVGSPAVGIAGALLVTAGSGPGMTAAAWALVGAGVALMAAALVWGSAIYMRVVDEQERDANLWGCYVGATVYLALYMVQLLLAGLGVKIPHVHDTIFGIFLVTTLGVFAWKRYR